MRNLNNPIAFPTIQSLLVAVLNVVIIIATPIVIFYLIYAGFLYVTAQGKPEKIQEANKAIMYGVIGGVIILGAVAITTIIGSTVDQFSN
jgi:NADH:ubiquinone oxidoreductase subunit 4 (subunit M)